MLSKRWNWAEEQMWFLPSKLYPQDLGDNELMVGIESESLKLSQKKIGCFSPQPSPATFSLCHLQKEISEQIFIQCKIGVSPERWSVLIWTSWGSGSCFSEITLRLLLFQLYFGAIFVLALFRRGSETTQRNWGVMELHWNKLETIFKLWPTGIHTNPWINGLTPEKQDRLSGYLQRFTLLCCLSSWSVLFLLCKFWHK